MLDNDDEATKTAVTKTERSESAEEKEKREQEELKHKVSQLLRYHSYKLLIITRIYFSLFCYLKSAKPLQMRQLGQMPQVVIKEDDVVDIDILR